MDNKNMEAVDMINKSIDSITSELKALRTKGSADAEAQNEQVKELKATIADAMKTHEKHSDAMKEMDKANEKCKELEKAIGELDMRTKNMNTKHMGLVSGSSFARLKNEMAKEFASCIKTNGNQAVSMTMTNKDFQDTFIKKSAGNMTESGNFAGEFVIAPDRLPGFFAPPLRPVHIREFINQATTTSNLINYSQETEAFDGSGSTAQGTSAGQSDFTLTAQQMIVQKINAYFQVSKEMLEDTPVTENYIRTRGVQRLMMFEDTALLTGNGSGANQYGIIPVASAYADIVIPGATSTSINGYDVLYAAVTQAKVSYYTPNYIIIHPNDYLSIALARDTYGRYQFPQLITGGPGDFYINGALVIQNTAMSQGTFLVGDFNQGATMFTRDEVEITFSNQNVDNFVKGFITVLVEERIGQAIYRPTAFITGTFAQGIISGS